MKTNLRLVLSIPIYFFCFYSFSQNLGEYWREDVVAGGEITASGQPLQTGAGRRFTLDEAGMARALEPLRSGTARAAILYFPDATGVLKPFRVEERSVMSPQLQARYPEIRSYVGVSQDAAQTRIRFSLSPQGFQAMISAPEGRRTQFIEKIRGRTKEYLQFSRDEKQSLPGGWVCKTTPDGAKAVAETLPAQLVEDGVLRRYRLAVAATGEYTQYHGGTVAGALAAINATVTRINEVFERDLAISLELIATNDQVIYTDPATDPFGGNLSAEVQNTLTTRIGAAAYDIGHLFHSAGETGNAGYIGAVCTDNEKGSAYAATPIPEGDRFDLDFVAHEMGHQFGANHTWSFDSEGTGVQAEPASGSTIMGYAGIVQGNNVTLTGDDYFHYFSILQISQFVAGLSCAAEIPLPDAAPVVTPLPDYLIPKGTAFVLEGVATDADPGDVLTYAWEQVDDGVVTTSTFGPENPSGANFRSRRPGTDPNRYFPMLPEVVAGNLTQTNPPTDSAWETVSTIERDLNFALTVRDNAPGGGQVGSDLVRVSVLAGAGPFEVRSQLSPQTYAAGSVQSISWEVAGTDAGPINCQEVDLYMSLDGGLTFPVALATALPNTGSTQVQLPGDATAAARFMLKAADNIFFAVNAADFTITEQPFVLQGESLDIIACQPADTQLGFLYRSFAGYSETVNLDVLGLPAGVTANFDVPAVQADSTAVTLTLSNTDLAAPGVYPLVLNGTGPSQSFSLPFELTVSDGTFPTPALLNPADGALDVPLDPVLQWQGNPAISAYELELATDAAFSAIVEQQTIYGTVYRPSTLPDDTDFYWRVRPVSGCGLGAFSSAFRFRTITKDCKTLSANGLPIAISATGTPTVTATVTFADDKPVVSARVYLDLAHSYLSDLVITLTSPAGTEVTLISNSCAEANDVQATFEAGAPPFLCSNNPAISGVVRPLGSLDSFAGESSFGAWVLTIQDTAPADGGQLKAFSLELCVEGQFRPDDDGDGVFDDGDDLCLGTPAGVEVDATGCPVYRFDPDQFDISLESERCVGSGDGVIRIQAAQPLDYLLSIRGNGRNQDASFTSSYELGGLSEGAYQLCIEGTDGTIFYEPQCYDLVIGSPPPLSVLASQSVDGSQLALALDGSGSYQVTLNGQTQAVSASQLSLKLAPGPNTLLVEAIPACGGTFEAVYYYADRLAVAPNPFTDILQFQVPETGRLLQVQIFNVAGALVMSREWVPMESEVTMPVAELPTGFYLVRIRCAEREETFKVYRQ